MNRDIKMKAIALSVLATTLAVSWSARAETIFLQCAEHGSSSTYTVDLTNNTVDNHPANINQTSIDWQYNIGSQTPGLTAVLHKHIDRTTGQVTTTATYNNNGQISTGYDGPHSCTVGGPPPTKF